MLSSWDRTPRVFAPLRALRAPLDRALVGHDEAKLGVLIAGIADVAIRISGPCGCGKSTLARVGAALFAAAPHERERSSPPLAASLFSSSIPWMGAAGAIVQRERSAASERVRFIRSGDRSGSRRVTAPVVDLDASGNSLEQTWIDSDRFGVVTAPAELDASVILGGAARLSSLPMHVRMKSLVLDPAAEALCARDDPGGSAAAASAAERALASRLRDRARSLPLSEAVRRRLHAHLAAAERMGSTGDESRSAIPAWAALRVLRAHAVLHGSQRVEAADLAALRFTRVLEEAGIPDERTALYTEQVRVVERAAAPLTARASGTTGSGTVMGEGASRRATAAPLWIRDVRIQPEPTDGLPAESRALDAVDALDALVRRLESHWGRRGKRRSPDPAGAPRRLRSLRTWDEIIDADPVDVWDYIDGCRPDGVRVAERARARSGATLAILRDVSASMQGPVARWCGRLVGALIDAARARRWRVGYVEFHDGAERHLFEGRLFHDRYAALHALAARARAHGRTNYQAPLRALLDHAAHAECGAHAVLVTDGIPVVGDPAIVRERGELRARGWRLHTVFVGLGETPAILRQLAHETGGTCARVLPRPGGAFVLVAERARA